MTLRPTSIQAEQLQDSEAQSFHWPGPWARMLCKGKGATWRVGFPEIQLSAEATDKEGDDDPYTLLPPYIRPEL